MHHQILPVMKKILAIIPTPVHTRTIMVVLNHLITQNHLYLNPLDNKTIGIQVLDLGINLRLHCRAQQFSAAQSHATAHVLISGEADTFIALIKQDIDSDTLFFERKLTIEGETETGLALRNIMDSIDWEEQTPLLKIPYQLMRLL